NPVARTSAGSAGTARRCRRFTCGRVSRRGRRLHAGQEDGPNADRRVRLAVAAKPAIVLTAAGVRGGEIDGRGGDHLAADARPPARGPADPSIVAAVKQQDPAELKLAADISVTVVELDHIALGDPVLSGTVFKYCIHGWPRNLRNKTPSVRIGPYVGQGIC